MSDTTVSSLFLSFFFLFFFLSFFLSFCLSVFLSFSLSLFLSLSLYLSFSLSVCFSADKVVDWMIRCEGNYWLISSHPHPSPLAPLSLTLRDCLSSIHQNLTTFLLPLRLFSPSPFPSLPPPPSFSPNPSFISPFPFRPPPPPAWLVNRWLSIKSWQAPLQHLGSHWRLAWTNRRQGLCSVLTQDLGLDSLF